VPEKIVIPSEAGFIGSPRAREELLQSGDEVRAYALRALVDGGAPGSTAA
jgi:hypothetical protein